MLSQFREAAKETNKSIHTLWADVLDVHVDDVQFALCEVASLLPAIAYEVERANRPELTETLTQHGDAWASPDLSTDHLALRVPGPGPDIVDYSALLALGMVSALLSTNSEVTELTEENAASLRTQLQGAVDEVLSSDDLPRSVQALILSRLHDVIWSLDHLIVTGADGVSAATERLVGALLFARVDEDAASSSAFTKVVNVAKFAWDLLRKGPEMQEMIESWTKITELMP